MLLTPLRKAIVAGAGIFAVGVAAGVGVHAAAGGSATLTAATTATPSTTPTPGAGDNTCKPADGGAEFGPARQVLGIAASVLGQTQQQILDQLRSGKTLDQIAGSKASTIEQQALDKLKVALDKRVSAGKLSSSQESDMLSKAKTALDTAMSSDLSSKIPPAGAGAACGPRGGLLGMLVKATADKTGLSVQQVMDDLKAGQSIDQIAGSHAADVKAEVLQMLQSKESAAIDKIMGSSGLGAQGGKGFGRLGGPNKPKASPTPSA